MNKRLAVRFLLCIELTVFGYVYLFGKNGLHTLTALHTESDRLHEVIRTVHNEVEDLERELSGWQNHRFYHEKVAREQLQMIKTGDQVYYY